MIVFVGGGAMLFFAETKDTTGISDAGNNCRITKIVDGDTIDLTCQTGQTERIRILGYDTPETYYAECPAEKQLGDAATRYLRDLAARQPVTRVERTRKDRYDRTLAHIWIGGENLANIMVAENLAVPYTGNQRISWCERLNDAG